MRKKVLICIFVTIFIAVFAVSGVISANSFKQALASAETTEFSYAYYDAYEQRKSVNEAYDVWSAASDFEVSNPQNMKESGETNGYASAAYLWGDDEPVSFHVNAKEQGDYHIIVDYFPLNESFEHIVIDVAQQNKETPDEFNNVKMPSYLRFEVYDFEKNNLGNEIYPEHEVIKKWMKQPLKEGESKNSTNKLILSLDKGENQITLSKREGTLLLGNIYFVKAKNIAGYEEYKNANPQAAIITEQFILEGEKFYSKSENYISIMNNRAAEVSPYHSSEILLNMVDPKTFKNHGDRLAYLVDIKTSGYYNLGMKATMPGKSDSPIFVDIEVDGEIPFREFQSYALNYQRAMFNHYIEKYPVYLDKGVHEIAFAINGDKYFDVSEAMNRITEEVNELSISITKLTGNSQDTDREWILTDYFPNIVPTFESWKNSILEIKSRLLELSEGKSTEEIQKVQLSLTQLEKLIANPNKVPHSMAALSQGSTSILQLLTLAKLSITVQSLGVDSVIIGGDGSKLPMTNGNAAFTIGETAKAVVRSFKSGGVLEKEKSIDIWINRTRQYADVIQNLTEESFTVKTGIKVNFSIITDYGKVTLANAANKQPDIVMGIPNFYINELGHRKTLADLKQFDNALDVIGNAAPGALLQMIVDDQLLGLPESQDLFLLFYRSDIMEQYGWKIPETWEDVLLMLPQLSQQGMNFYLPLARNSSFKSWDDTLPFYAQNGVEIYSPDGTRTLIDTDRAVESMKFMTELFQIYGLPMQVPSFSDVFRSGQMPIGVSNLATYVQLAFSAPEIVGKWSVALLPGMKNENDEIERWTPGSSTAVSIFEKSDKKDMAWEYLQWWMSDEIQDKFTSRLSNMYGQEYLWFSGNTNVMEKAPIPKEHQEVIAQQIPWIKQAPKIPGGYFTEREVSNAFGRVMFEGQDARSAVDEAAMVANREIKRKLIELGYIDVNGNIIKPYIVPTIEGVEGWSEIETD